MKSHNRHIPTYLFILTMLILPVSSCTPPADDSEQHAATVLPPATLPVITNTATPLPTVEIVSTLTSQETIELSLGQECIPVEEKLPDDLNLSGVWVRNSGIPYLETTDGHTAYVVPLQGGEIFSTSKGDMAISPDGQYLAYIDAYIDETGRRTDSRILRVIKSSGHSLPMDYWIINWQWLIGWLDNQHLAIFTGNKEVLILEPFTGSWEKLQPPSWLGNIDYDYYPYEGPFYSPGLHSILVKSDYSNFELRDFQTGETIYEGNGYLNHWDLDWSADGSTLVIGSGTLLVISRNKQVIEIDTSKFEIDTVNYPKLSPNGQKVVFTSYFSGKLFVFDIRQLDMRRLCTDEFNFWKEAAWSPDGRFVVQETYRSYSDQFDILIDTQQLRAYKLISGQYQHRLAWLANP